MKKHFILLFIFGLFIYQFCFADTENDMELENILESTNDMQNNILETIKQDEENIENISEILQENEEIINSQNAAIAQQEIIAEEKKKQQKLRKRKLKNDGNFSGYYIAGDFPFSFVSSSLKNDISESANSVGFSLGMFSALNHWSYKLSVAGTNFTIVNTELDSSVLSLSLGRAPINNYRFTFAYYLTIGFESLNEESCFNIGGSTTLLFGYESLRVYLNFDAIYRNTTNEKIIFIDNSWRISPSIGFALLVG